MNTKAEKLEASKIEPFKLKDQSGTEVDSTSIDSPYLVLFFYPKDSTPGCTKEAIAFSERLTELQDLGASVFGVSGGTSASKAKFCERSALKVSLLADEDLTLAKSIRSFGPKKFMGRSYEGILRKTFVLDQDLNILAEIEDVKPELHAAEVIKFLESLK